MIEYYSTLNLARMRIEKHPDIQLITKRAEKYFTFFGNLFAQ